MIPNQGILIDTLSLQEARVSSEIENIVTTNDALFKGGFEGAHGLGGPQKEVAMYRDALHLGHENIRNSGFISNRMLIEMFRVLKNRDNGFRKIPGTVLSDGAGRTVYVPPQDGEAIEAHMKALEVYMNSADSLDPLIRMAIIHHQFESIHPFPDGNGRLGRMLNVLYLTQCGLLDIPVLYMSRGILRRKGDYYRLLQAVRDDGDWESWIIYVLDVVSETSCLTLDLIEGIRSQIATFKSVLRERHPKVYSQDLVNNLFRHPYTRIEYVMHDLQVSRPTATSYLEKLVAEEALPVTKFIEGRNSYYVNSGLFDLLARS